jgi:SHS family lactate transporter-like MFS transporter
LVLALGSFMMQFGVQGVFGVIPAHLNEMAPARLRSLFSGLIYQLGMLIGAPSVTIQFEIQKHLGYPWALASFEIGVIVCLLFLFGFGPEKQHRDFAE